MIVHLIHFVDRLLMLIKAILIQKFPYSVPIPVDTLLKLCCRVFHANDQCVPNGRESLDEYEFVKSLLSLNYSPALELLTSIMIATGSSILRYRSFICQNIMEPLLITSRLQPMVRQSIYAMAAIITKKYGPSVWKPCHTVLHKELMMEFAAVPTGLNASANSNAYDTILADADRILRSESESNSHSHQTRVVNPAILSAISEKREVILLSALEGSARSMSEKYFICDFFVAFAVIFPFEVIPQWPTLLSLSTPYRLRSKATELMTLAALRNPQLLPFTLSSLTATMESSFNFTSLCRASIDQIMHSRIRTVAAPVEKRVVSQQHLHDASTNLEPSDVSTKRSADSENGDPSNATSSTTLQADSIVTSLPLTKKPRSVFESTVFSPPTSACLSTNGDLTSLPTFSLPAGDSYRSSFLNGDHGGFIDGEASSFVAPQNDCLSKELTFAASHSTKDIFDSPANEELDDLADGNNKINDNNESLDDVNETPDGNAGAHDDTKNTFDGKNESIMESESVNASSDAHDSNDDFNIDDIEIIDDDSDNFV